MAAASPISDYFPIIG